MIDKRHKQEAEFYTAYLYHSAVGQSACLHDNWIGRPLRKVSGWSKVAKDNTFVLMLSAQKLRRAAEMLSHRKSKGCGWYAHVQHTNTFFVVFQMYNLYFFNIPGVTPHWQCCVRAVSIMWPLSSDVSSDAPVSP